jgi:hypothetical protein
MNAMKQLLCCTAIALALLVTGCSIRVRSSETRMKTSLFVLRMAIDEYTFDKQQAPRTLLDLVDQGYLQGVPRDLITGNNETWRVINQDVRVGTPYVQW